jgi:hypothetical protein
MNLIKLVEEVRKELYPNLKLIEVSQFPLRRPIKTLVQVSTGLFPYEEIWDRAYTVEYQPEKPLGTLTQMLKLERYLFKDVEMIAYTDKLWTYEYEGRPLYVIRCAQVNKE